MGVAFAGLLILAVFVAGVLVMFRTALHGNVLISGATKSSGQLVGERARTVIGITSATSDGTCNLTVVVENTGATTISGTDFPLVDFIMEFSVATNPPRRMIHSSPGPPGFGEWVRFFDHRSIRAGQSQPWGEHDTKGEGIDDRRQ